MRYAALILVLLAAGGICAWGINSSSPCTMHGSCSQSQAISAEASPSCCSASAPSCCSLPAEPSCCAEGAACCAEGAACCSSSHAVASKYVQIDGNFFCAVTGAEVCPAGTVPVDAAPTK